MKQLYYTSCKAGKSVGGSSGFQIRAVSRGLPGDQLRTAVLYAGYSLPPGVLPSEDLRHRAPVRLAFLETPDMGHVLCHSTYVGKDPMTGRYGNFFSHLLLGLPKEVDAARAISSWGSSLWRREDDDSGPDLPDLRAIPKEGKLNDDALLRFLGKPSNCTMVGFVLRALLTTGPDHRIFLAAPADDVATCVYAVTRALPRNLLEKLNFTFSTYEHEPLTCSARLVGTCLDDVASMDLPSSCYTGICLGYNSYTGRSSEPPPVSPYADFAVKTLASPQGLDTVDRFRSKCEAYQIADSPLFELFYLANTQGGLDAFSREQGQALLAHAPLATWAVGSGLGKALLGKVVHWAGEDAEYARSAIRTVGKTLARPGVIEKLHGLAEGAATRLRAWALLQSFLKNPLFDAGSLNVLAQELAAQPKDLRKETLDKVSKAAAKGLLVLAGRGDVYGQLANLLTLLGPHAPGGREGLYRSLLAYYVSGDAKFWSRIHILHALLAAGLGAFPDELLDRDQLDGEVRSLVKQIRRRRGGRKRLRAIQSEVREWANAEARTRWRGLTAKSLRPWWRRALPLMVLGALLALLAGAEWKWGILRNRFGNPQDPPSKHTPPSGKEGTGQQQPTRRPQAPTNRNPSRP